MTPGYNKGNWEHTWWPYAPPATSKGAADLIVAFKVLVVGIIANIYAHKDRQSESDQSGSTSVEAPDQDRSRHREPASSAPDEPQSDGLHDPELNRFMAWPMTIFLVILVIIEVRRWYVFVCDMRQQRSGRSP